MSPIRSPDGVAADLGRAALKWLAGWWRLIHFGAELLVLALSPAVWRGANRTALARHVYLATAPVLPWFTALSALISLVVIRIVIVTALGYGLTRYALEMVVRVLVLELIPLAAAMFVAIRITLPHAVEVAALRARGEFDAPARQGADPLLREVLPRVASGVFSVLMLAAVSCAVTLVLAYLSVYGFTTGGFAGYTHTVGRIFGPGVALIFALKTFFFALTVAVVPIASVLHEPARARTRASAELQGLVRMFVLLLLIEAASLVGNYY